MSNIIYRGAWDIRRHNYLVRHNVEQVAEARTRRPFNCEFCQSTLECTQCVGAVAGSVCMT